MQKERERESFCPLILINNLLPHNNYLILSLFLSSDTKIDGKAPLLCVYICYMTNLERERLKIEQNKAMKKNRVQI